MLRIDEDAIITLSEMIGDDAILTLLFLKIDNFAIIKLSISFFRSESVTIFTLSLKSIDACALLKVSLLRIGDIAPFTEDQ